MRTGIANLPLHHGCTPPWLFQRMKKLAKAITGVIVYEYNQNEFLRRLADPFWFQAFSCVLGFDWHSSGCTTVTCSALKEALNNEYYGVVVCGGKGKTSRKTPKEIERFSENFSLSTKKIEKLKHASKMSAKVDNAVLQDGYDLYHHCFLFTEKGKWVVIQQGMNPLTRYARRYHWLSDNVKSFVKEPHSAICCDERHKRVLNMVAKESKDAQKQSVDIVKEKPDSLKWYFGEKGQKTLDEFARDKSIPTLTMQHGHSIKVLTKQTLNALKNAYEIQPSKYEELVAIKGIGPASIRALALISALVYGQEPSWKDPVKFSFAHGGKDGYPYPVNRKSYDSSIEMLENAIKEARLGDKDKIQALRRLNEFL